MMARFSSTVELDMSFHCVACRDYIFDAEKRLRASGVVEYQSQQHRAHVRPLRKVRGVRVRTIERATQRRCAVRSLDMMQSFEHEKKNTQRAGRCVT